MPCLFPLSAGVVLSPHRFAQPEQRAAEPQDAFGAGHDGAVQLQSSAGPSLLDAGRGSRWPHKSQVVVDSEERPAAALCYNCQKLVCVCVCVGGG